VELESSKSLSVGVLNLRESGGVFKPRRVRAKPADDAAEVNNGRPTLELNPFTVVRVRAARDK